MCIASDFQSEGQGWNLGGVAAVVFDFVLAQYTSSIDHTYFGVPQLIHANKLYDSCRAETFSCPSSLLNIAKKHLNNCQEISTLIIKIR